MLVPSSRTGAARLLHRCYQAALLLFVGILIAPAIARAGGDFVDLAVGSSRVWFVGEPGVREFDARSGRTLSTPRLVGAPYPLSVTLAGGAAWVASVENGYVWGTLSRIDTRTRKLRVVWRKPDSSVQYVAAGAGGIWALIGSAGSTEIALFGLDGHLRRVWKITGAGRMAADGSGCWISTNSWLLHIDTKGRLHRVLRAPLGDVATGAGAAWLPRTTSVLRVDERSGRVRTLVTGRLRLGGFQHDLAADENVLWALTDTGRAQTRLTRFDPQTGKATGSVSVPGIADAVVAKRNAVWVATVIAPAAKPATGYDLIRIDPQTLHRVMLIHIN
jgi:DNA-binding beta-propeller fold protein YncE